MKWFITAVAAAALAGAVIYEVTPVHVESGVIKICTDLHHTGNIEVGRQVQEERVPRWRAKRYAVSEENVVCGSCQTKIAEEERRAREEAERQARIDAVIGFWEEHVSFGGSQWVFNRDGTGHTVNFTGSFNFTWEIEGDRLHVTTRREDLSIPFEATARTLTLRRPEGTITYARVE